MFRVSNNIDSTITNKKKLLFISTMPSNETSSFEPKNSENPKISQTQAISKSSTLCVPANIPKKTKKYFENSNNDHSNKKIIPMKRILFRLYRMNFVYPKKERVKNQSKNKKQNNIKKNGNNLKHKPIQLPKKINNNTFNNKNYSAGRWKSDEHKRFIDAIIRYGNNWRQVQKYVGTRSNTQTRSHAQKFFEKLKRSQLFKRENYYFSKNSLKILHDIMKNLPDKEYEITLKALHSLSYDKNTNSEIKQNSLQINNNNDLNINANYNENINEKINYDGNNNININIGFEENKKSIKFSNQGYCFLESNNNKICINDDYLLYNNSSNGNNINSNNNNYTFNDYLNNDIKSFGGKESDFINQRKYSLSEMNINIKDLKEKNDTSDDNDLDYNLNYNLFNNNLNLNPNQDNKININNLFDINEEKIGYKQQFNNQDFIFNQQRSRKMSLE